MSGLIYIHQQQMQKYKCMIEYTILLIKVKNISNNSSFRQEHPGIPDDSDSAYGITYPLMENYVLPVPQMMGCVACLPSVL